MFRITLFPINGNKIVFENVTEWNWSIKYEYLTFKIKDCYHQTSLPYLVEEIL